MLSVVSQRVPKGRTKTEVVCLYSGQGMNHSAHVEGPRGAGAACPSGIQEVRKGIPVRESSPGERQADCAVCSGVRRVEPAQAAESWQSPPPRERQAGLTNGTPGRAGGERQFQPHSDPREPAAHPLTPFAHTGTLRTLSLTSFRAAQTPPPQRTLPWLHPLKLQPLAPHLVFPHHHPLIVQSNVSGSKVFVSCTTWCILQGLVHSRCSINICGLRERICLI